jgi:integrase/recombinase XerD
MHLYKDKYTGIYQIIYKYNGKWSRKTTSQKKIVEARKVFNEFVRNEEGKKKRKRILLEDYFDLYYKYHEPTKSKHYLRSIKLSFRQLLKYTGNIYIDEIDLETIDQFISHVAGRSKAVSMQCYSNLKTAFNKAVLWDYIKENYFKKTTVTKPRTKLPRYINEEQFQMIYKNTDKQYLKDMFIVAFDTGMRAAELCSMKWDWVDFTQRIITVSNDFNFTTKSKRERIIPMTERVRCALLKRYNWITIKTGADVVFWRVLNVKLNEDYIYRKFKKAVVKAGIDLDINLHTLRHSFASRLVQKNVSLYIVQKLLGHACHRTTQIYSHLIQDTLHETLNKIDSSKKTIQDNTQLKILYFNKLG